MLSSAESITARSLESAANSGLTVCLSTIAAISFSGTLFISIYLRLFAKGVLLSSSAALTRPLSSRRSAALIFEGNGIPSRFLASLTRVLTAISPSGVISYRSLIFLFLQPFDFIPYNGGLLKAFLAYKAVHFHTERVGCYLVFNNGKRRAVRYFTYVLYRSVYTF